MSSSSRYSNSSSKSKSNESNKSKSTDSKSVKSLKSFKEKDNWIEALDTYYKYKAVYEKDYMKLKNEIISNDALSWKEKRRQFAKKIPECFNCKRKVGTNFYTSNEEGERTIGARC